MGYQGIEIVNVVFEVAFVACNKAECSDLSVISTLLLWQSIFPRPLFLLPARFIV
jgi:hypothetical protein